MIFSRIRKIITLGLVVVLGFALVWTGQASPLEERIRRQQEQLTDLEGGIDAHSEQLAEYQSEEQRLVAELHNLNNSLTLLRRELEALDQEIEFTEESIRSAEEELRAAEEQIQHRDEMLKNRLQVIYENGSTGYLDVLLEAYSFAEFLTRLNDLKLIAEADLQLLEIAYEERRVIEEKKRALEVEKEELLELKVQRLDRRDDLNRKLASRESLLDRVQEAIEAQERAIAELEKESEKLESMIVQLQEELRRQTERFTPSGQLLWPVEGYGYSWITSPFGPRTHPITGRAGVFHGGVDIGIPRNRWPGSPSYNGNPVYIRAAERGVVSFASVSGSLSYGYGRMVIIEHGQIEPGQSMTTVYAHCHTLLVSPQQEVGRGEPIAIVGSTGSSTGPHLHFEVRINGVRKNPMGFFN